MFLYLYDTHKGNIDLFCYTMEAFWSQNKRICICIFNKKSAKGFIEHSPVFMLNIVASGKEERERERACSVGHGITFNCFH